MTSPRPADVRCPSCAAVARASDDACGWCGAALSVLRIKDGARLVDERSAEIDVVVENVGVVDAAFVLRRIDARHFPPWLKPMLPVDEALVVPAAGHISVRFAVDAARLGDGRSPSRHVVPLVTSVVRYSDDKKRAQRRVLAIELATAARLSLWPGHAIMPFVAVEAFERGVEHKLRIDNAGGHATRIGDVVVGGANGLVVDVDGAGALVPAEGSIDVTLTLRPTARLRRLVDDEGPQTMQLRIRVSGLSTDAEANDVVSTLAMSVGRGPTLHAPSPPLLHTAGRATRASVELCNTGHRPVTIVGLTLASAEGITEGEGGEGGKGGERASTSPLWVRLEKTPSSVADGAHAGVVVDAGATHRVGILVEPDRRRPEDLDTALFEAELVVEHDGAVDAHAPPLRVTIRADLGRCAILDGATLGVDFGTSNSAVSMFHGASGTIHALPLDRASGREALASLLYFAGARGSDAIDGFLVGAAADNAAAENLSNLVRQLKSVVARAPQTAWHFASDGAGIVRRSTHELLACFFAELKRRAEEGLRALPLSFLAELDLVDRAVRFRHAVFSHPVGADAAMLQALYQAAREAGLADDIDVDTFIRERCVDEALAASLSWVYLATQSSDERSLRDDERVMCFDAGGGTCDIAAVAVDNMALFRARPANTRVRCRLLASGGDARLGGSDIDRLLAEHLLAEVMTRGGHVAGVADAAIKAALFYPSFEAWRRASGDADGARSRSTYHAATELLRSAERVKKALSREASASVVVVFDAWPRHSGQRGAAADRVEVTVSRATFDGLVAAPFAAVAERVDAIVAAAGWSADDVTTVLFTGQTSHIPALRQAVLARFGAAGRRRPLNVVEPGAVPGFDVKRCVAQGASILGDSRRGGGGWLVVERRSSSALAMPLSMRRGPLLVPITGLEADTPLPARAPVNLTEAATRLVIYVAGAPAYEASWDSAVTDVVVEVINEGVVEVVAGDVRVTARRIS